VTTDLPAQRPDQPRRRRGRGQSRGQGRGHGRSPRGDTGRDRGTDERRTDERAAQQRSAAAAKRAAVVVPPITFPEQLPVSARREEIAAAIAANQVVIVSGETGSGKTTQLPKILLEMGRGRAGQIGHTQPRRIAARTVAERIAEELGVPLGGVVGYQVRFTDQSSDETLVRVMTDGILLAQLQRDPQLLAYDTLVIDEAHERSLNIDFILGYLARLLPQRPDLKVVITSATIDSERFAAHFAPAHLRELSRAWRGGGDQAAGSQEAEPQDVRPTTLHEADAVTTAVTGAPVITVTGRTYPVEIRYRPLVGEAETGSREAAGSGSRVGSRRASAEDRDLLTGIVDAVDELCLQGPGDILVFLSGEREIHDATSALEGHFGERTYDARRPDYIEVTPLYARLSSAEQHRVFQPHAGRRIVLATNVAETSLTVPGIRYVVDPGTARISRYSKATKVQRLPIEPISQASANQRAGRCGRVADGVAIRLYSEEDFEGRPEFTEPEILRTSLASVLLHMLSVGVARTPGDVARFPFVEPPDTRAVRDGVQLLTELGALAPTGKRAHGGSDRPTDAAGPHVADAAEHVPGGGLTRIGRDLAQLPMDPRLARMILEANRHGVVREVMIIAAALSVQDPRERPAEERTQADQAHARFTDPTSDFLSYLNLWEYLREQQRDLSSSAFRRMCRSEHINFLRVREWQDVVAQLREMAKPIGIRVNLPTRGPRATDGAGGSGAVAATPAGTVPVGTAAARAGAVPGRASGATSSEAPLDEADHRKSWPADNVHRSLLAGLLSQLGMQETVDVKASAVAHLKGEARERAIKRAKRQARNEYLGARGARFAIFPGSPLSKKPPAWIMAGELVETSRLWARDVARVQPEWAEELAAHLVKRTYSNPTWSRRQGAAVAIEKVLLYGVPIVADRQVLYGKVDPAQAREMFLRHALVDGDWITHHAFFAHNAEVRAQAAELEARSRRRDLVLDDEALFAFYDERVPDEVVSARHFDTWWKGARRSTPDLLDLSLATLVPEADEVDPEQFPAHWPQGDLQLPLTYQFQPGTDSDGVTVHIPVAALNQVVPDGFDWMVPGLLDELAVATIRALPKAVRVQLVPAPDVARAVVAWIGEHCPRWADVARAGDMAESFRSTFSRAVRELRDVVVPEDAFDDEKLPAHLRMTFRVVEPRGSGGDTAAVMLDESKDLLAVQRRLAAQAQAAVSSAVRSAVRTALRDAMDEATAEAAPSGTHGGRALVRGPARAVAPGGGAAESGAPASDVSRGTEDVSIAVAEREHLTSWPEDLDEMPESVRTSVAGTVVRGYPGLVHEPGPKGGEIALRVLSDPARRDTAHRDGVRRLLLGELRLAQGRITSRWTTAQSLTLAASPYRNTEDLVDDLQLAAIVALTPQAVQIRSHQMYDKERTRLRGALENEVHRIVGDVVAALSAARDLDVRLREVNGLSLLATAADLRSQLTDLVHPGFVSQTPPRHVPHLVRYLRAATHRLAKAQEDPRRDETLAWRVRDVTEAYERARQDLPQGTDTTGALDEVPWMIQELRVSLFAQQLGTDGPISEKRIHKVLGTKGW